MKKIFLLLFSVLLTVSELYAKDGKIKYGNVIYHGNVEHKFPLGQGALYYKGSNVAFLKGNFFYYLVKDATFSIGNIEYWGDVAITPSDKTSDKIMSFKLINGNIKYAGKVENVSFEAKGDYTNPTYTITDSIIHVKTPSEDRITYSNVKLSQDYIYEKSIDSIVFTSVKNSFTRTLLNKNLNLWRDDFHNSEDYIIGVVKHEDNIERIQYRLTNKKFNCYAEAKDYDVFEYKGESKRCDKGTIVYSDGSKFNGIFLFDIEEKPLLINGTLHSYNTSKQKYEDYQFENCVNKTLEMQRIDNMLRLRADSIAIAEGRLLPKYTCYTKNCIVKEEADIWGSFLDALYSVCSGDVIYYAGKQDLDNLGQHIYLKSEQFQSDKLEMEKYRNTTFAFVLYLDHADKFQTDGYFCKFYHHAFIHGAESMLNYEKDYINVGKLLFPIKSGLFQNYNKYIFKESNIERLITARNAVNSDRGNIRLLILFKPNVLNKTKYMYLVNPIGLYLINYKTGETLLDLSGNFRKPDPIIDNKKIKEIETEIKKRQSKPRSKSKHYCYMCGGKGYRTGSNMGGIKGKTTARCFTCDGTGYVYY